MVEDRKRVVIPELGKIAQFLGQVDHHIISAIAKRMNLAVFVEQRKRLEDGNQPILRRETEEVRLQQAQDWAEESGIDPNFGRLIEYLLISESCRVQIAGRELYPNQEEERSYTASKEEWYRYLRQNLLALAAEVAPVYDEKYSQSAPFATSSYILFEEHLIKREIDTLKAIQNAHLAVDIGCATGRMTFQLAPHFSQVIGYDISPEMIQRAKDKANQNSVSNVQFEVADIEERLPLERNSVSLAIMNLGTASDIHNTRALIATLNGILKKDGRFLLSFYNQNALYYQCFVPWQLPLIAEIDAVRHCLGVTVDQRTFQVYARPYTIKEIEGLVRRSPGLKISEIISYPTIASILPDEFFANKQSRKLIQEVDSHLLHSGIGAYILAIGRKVV